jgi:hypothetical protein
VPFCGINGGCDVGSEHYEEYKGEDVWMVTKNMKIESFGAH